MNLYIDDIRTPPSDKVWKVARTSAEAFDFICTNGIPDFISFDHDLGGEDTSMVFVKKMAQKIMDKECFLPKNFSYAIHSANTEGSKNIKSYMDMIIKHLS